MNLTKIPSTIESAVEQLVSSLTDDDKNEIAKMEATEVHFSVGRHIRNEWNLWAKDSPMKRDAVEQYKIAHADDISGLLCSWVFAKVNGNDFDPFNHCLEYHRHWANQGMTALTAGGWPP